MVTGIGVGIEADIGVASCDPGWSAPRNNPGGGMWPRVVPGRADDGSVAQISVPSHTRSMPKQPICGHLPTRVSGLPKATPAAFGHATLRRCPYGLPAAWGDGSRAREGAGLTRWTSSIAEAILVPSMREAIFWNAMSRARWGEPCLGLTSMLTGEKPQSPVCPDAPPGCILRRAGCPSQTSCAVSTRGFCGSITPIKHTCGTPLAYLRLCSPIS